MTATVWSGGTRDGERQLQPVRPIRFGSSDLAGLGYQHVDGGIRVGRRLADDVFAVNEERH